MALGIYALFAFIHDQGFHATQLAYYNYLADAFLHGELHLRLAPPAVHDLIFYQGYYYLYWPPMPAVMLMPFVALFGVGFSDVLFTLAVAGLNVGLVALILRQAGRRGVIRLTRLQRAWLVLFFGIGTVHLTLAPLGRVWFTGQITGFTWVALAYLCALSLRGHRAFFFTGSALAGALLTRNQLLFAGLWPAYYLLREHWAWPRQRLAVAVILGLSPVLTAIGGFAAYNWLRFGSPLNVGLDYHHMEAVFVADYQKYGAFNLHYLPINFFYQYLAYPFPLRETSWMGGSLFLLSPLFLAALWSLYAYRARLDVWVLFATLLCVDAPILLLMGTGWLQFGPRYTLDFTIPLLLLTALGLRRWRLSLVAVLALISMVHYLAGMALFMRAVGW